MAEKNCFDMTKLICQNLGSTPGNAVFCSLYRFSFLFGLFILTLFFLLTFSLYSYCWPCWSCTWINIYFKLKSGVLFWKRDFKSSWSAYRPSLKPDKNHRLSRHPFSETAELFSMLADIMTNNTQYTTNCTNLLSTPTSDPLAKVKLAFCKSSLKSPLGLPPKNN